MFGLKVIIKYLPIHSISINTIRYKVLGFTAENKRAILNIFETICLLRIWEPKTFRLMIISPTLA